MPTPQDPLGLGDLPTQETAQGGFGTPVQTRANPYEEYRQAEAWANATRSVPATAYEDRNSYWKAKQEIQRQEEERERKRRLEEQQRQLDLVTARQRVAARVDEPGFREQFAQDVARGLQPMINNAAEYAQQEARTRARDNRAEAARLGVSVDEYVAYLNAPIRSRGGYLPPEVGIPIRRNQQISVRESPIVRGAEAFGRGLAETPLSPYQPAPSRYGTAEPRGAGESFMNTAGREVPYSREVAEVGGNLLARAAVNTPPGYALQKIGEQLPYVPTTEGMAKALVSVLVPRYAGELALEFIPGIGTVPDIARVLRRGGPEAAVMLERVLASPEGEKLIPDLVRTLELDVQESRLPELSKDWRQIHRQLLDAGEDPERAAMLTGPPSRKNPTATWLSDVSNVTSSYTPVRVYDSTYSTKSEFLIGEHIIDVYEPKREEAIPELSWSRREWEVRRGLGESVGWDKFGGDANFKDLLEPLRFVDDLLRANPDQEFSLYPASRRLGEVYERLFATRRPSEGDMLLDRDKVARLVQRLERGNVPRQLQLDVQQAMEVSSSRPYTNASDDVVRAHAEHGVKAAQDELALREREVAADPDAPTEEGLADAADQLLRQVPAAMPVISQHMGNPLRVFGHDFPVEFSERIAARGYLRSLTDAVAPYFDLLRRETETLGNMLSDAKLEDGRFGGITLSPGALAENHRTFRNYFERLPEAARKEHAEFAERTSYLNPFTMVRQGQATFGADFDDEALLGSILVNATHEMAHNWAIPPDGQGGHGALFTFLKDRLTESMNRHNPKAREQVLPSIRQLLNDQEFWDDYAEWQGLEHGIRTRSSTGRGAGAITDTGLDAERSTPSPQGGNQPPGGVAPAGAGAPAPGGAGQPPAAGGGAAGTPGAQPPPDEVELLLQHTTTEDLEKASYMRRVWESTRGAREYFTAANRTERATDRTAKEGARNIIVRYAGEILQAIPREAGIEARQLRREAGAMTKRQERAITGVLDNYDPASHGRFSAELTTEQLAVAAVMRMRIDAVADILYARGILDPETRVENYFPHIMDFVTQGRESMYGGGLRTPIKKPRNAIVTGHRTHETLSGAIAAGNRALTLDPFKIYEQFLVEAKSRLAMADIIDDIRTFDPDGVVHLRPGQDPPPGFQTIKHPMFDQEVAVIIDGDPRILRHRWAVRDNVASYIKSLVEPSWLRGNKVTKGLLIGTSSVKRTVLGGPLDINFLGFMLKAALYSNGTDVRKFLPGALHTGLMSDESFDQYLLQQVVYNGQQMTRADLYRRLDRAGLTTSGAQSEVARMMGGGPTPTLPSFIPFVGPWYERLQTFVEKRQFDRIIPTMKAESAAVLVEKKMRTSRGQRLGLEAMEREAANDMNQQMGGLNRIAQGRSKTAQDIAALAVIAPDWAEASITRFLGAFMPGANNATNRRALARWMVMGSIATVVGSYWYARERGWDEEQTLKYIGENISPVKIVNGKPRPNGHFMEYQMVGTGQWTSLLSFEKDALKLLMGAYGAATLDRSLIDMTAGGYLTSRIGVGPRFVIDYAYNRNYSGQPITENSGYRGFADWLAYEASQTFVPSFAGGVIQSQVPAYPGGKQSLPGAIHNATGLGRSRTISASDTIDRAVQDEHIPKYDENGVQIGEYMNYRELPNDIKGEFDKRHPNEAQDVIDAREARDRATFDERRRRTAEGLAEWAKLAPTDYKAYREGVADYMAKRGAVLQQTIEDLKARGITFTDRKGDQGLLDGYFEAVKTATDPKTDKTDFDERDRLEEEYRAGLTEFQNQRLDDMLGYSSDPTYKQLKAEKKQIADAGYFARYDAAWEEFAKHPEIEATGATNPDEFEQWVKDDLRRRGIAPELFDRHEYYGPWSDLLEQYTADILGPENAEIDLLVLKLGYGRRVHSQKAAELYRERYNLDPPVPSN